MAYLQISPLEAIHPFLDGNGRIGCLLINRLALHGADLNPPTQAELMGAFVDGSLWAGGPMNDAASYAYFKLFLSVFPGHPDIAPIAREHVKALKVRHGDTLIEDRANRFTAKLARDVAKWLPDRNHLWAEKCAQRPQRQQKAA